MPIVSICIPTYNRKNFLSETLNSVFAQTYKGYEVVIVDDGSTDGTDEMIKQAGYKVRYFWQENAGEAAARNKLIELAQGKFIAFIDSDDLLLPDAVERMVEAANLEKKDVIVYGNYIRIDENGNTCGKSKRKLYSGYITEHLFKDIIVHPNGSMFPQKALEEIGGFDTSLKVCTDYKLELQLSMRYSFIALDKPTFMHRRHSGNISQISYKNVLVELEMLKDFYYNLGGRDFVPEDIAKKRLAREAYRAGRSAIDEGIFEKGYELLKESYGLSPSLKTLYYLWKSKRSNERAQ